MKHIQKTQTLIVQNDITVFFREDCIFFDIETTGFSPKTSSIYLIGCLHRKGNELIIEQFFAESKEEETEILEKFTDSLNNYKTIISFNGLGFDLPFIKAKCDTYGIVQHINNRSETDTSSSTNILSFFDAFEYLDIFKEVSRIKPLLQLTNYKQKTIEQFLDIQRDDKYSGGELISVYEKYVKTHDPHAEELLLLHNFDDVVGMVDLLPILTYKEILNGAYTILSAETSSYVSYEGHEQYEVIITLKNNFSVPKRVSAQHRDYYITMNNDTTKIRIPVFEGELKYFYPNYKDHFYLPAEDMAIHKSVAAFVDKEYRQKAKASNCYTRKTGCFLPQYDTIINPVFKKEYKDKCTYFEMTEDFLNSKEELLQYTESILNNFGGKFFS